MPKWTLEQQQAIDLEGSNIIVSAGAGSGKTAVLTERVLRKLKSGVRIDHLLILTFTNLAAKEMKDRIRAKMREEASLKEQLDLLESSYIMTFDSFALFLVQKYHYLLDLPFTVGVGDENLIKQAMRNLLRQILDEKYEQEDASFLKLIETFYVRDDQDFLDSLLAIYKKLDLKYDKKTYLENYIATYYHPEYEKTLLDHYVSLLKDKVEEIKYQLSLLQYEVDGTFYQKMEDALMPLFLTSSYDEIVSVKKVKLPILRGGSENAKEQKEKISLLLKDLDKMTPYMNQEELLDTYDSTKNTVEVVVSLLLTFDQAFSRYKQEKQLFEFTDISKMAIRLVSDFPLVRTSLANSFNEILVDEYQDTSDLQELFLSKIERNNSYMVGDIKQSIYRFRNANPLIFKEKYENYKEGKSGRKIDLNKNFRSREEVLDDINLIFDPVMDLRLGGASYREDHRLIFGNNVYREQGKQANRNLEMVTYNPIFNYLNEEVEAFYIVDDIKKKIKEKYLVYDREQGTLRPCCYQDFVILMDRSTSFDLFKKIFTYCKVPLTIEKEENMAKEEDLLIFQNLIHLLIQTKKKNYDTSFWFSYTSIARSYLFSYSDDLIFEAVTKKKPMLLSMMEKVEEMSSILDLYPLTSLWNQILEKFSFYTKIMESGEVSSHINRFDYFADLLASLEEQGLTVYDLDQYLTSLIENKDDLKYNVLEPSSESVKIMTIHKSKGLEFPICYYAGLYREFNLRELNERFLYDSEYGIVAPYYKEGVGSTFVKKLVQDKVTEEEIGEKIRLFYVALTRAKEKIILVLPEAKKESTLNDALVDLSVRLKYRSFASLMESITSLVSPYKKAIKEEELNLTKEYKKSQKVKIDALSSTEVDPFIEVELPINKKVTKTTSYSKKVSLLTKEDQKKIEEGNRLHHLLESVDLKHLEKSEVLEKDLAILLPFANSSIVKEAKNIYQEYAFYDEEKKKRGVIDLILEHEDKIYIVDYKLKNIDDKAYKMQLKGYQAYLSKKTKKKTYLYLYSLLDQEFREIPFLDEEVSPIL